jgi:DNA-binding NarL/FixJ family response regulator
MAVKLLLIDPDIEFATQLKRSLEVLGEYRVHTFTRATPAFEFLQVEQFDAAILDFSIEDMPLTEVIASFTLKHPWILLIATPRTPEHIGQLVHLPVHGSITKPYTARQVAPTIKQAALTRARGVDSATPPRVNPLPPKPEGVKIAEPHISPDDTFRRMIQTFQEGVPQGAPSAISIEEPSIPEGATLRDLMSGKTPLPNTLPEQEAPPPTNNITAALAEILLEVAADQTIPTKAIGQALEQKAQSLPPDARPDWLVGNNEENLPSNDNASTLRGNAMSTEDLAGSFAGLLQDMTQASKAASDTPKPTAPGQPDPARMMALQLTKHMTGITAEAVMLSSAQGLIDIAGKLQDKDQKALLEEVLALWGNQSASGVKFKYVTLPNQADYLLYSTPTVDGMFLTLLFPGDVPLKEIRKQTKQLITAMQSLPEVIEPPDMPEEASPPVQPLAPPASIAPINRETTPSRPTDPMPLVALPNHLPEISEPALSDTPAIRAPQRPTGKYLSYGFVWLPRKDLLSIHEITLLPRWIKDAAAPYFYDVDMVDAQPTYVLLHLQAPESTPPSAVRSTIQKAVATQADNPQLWAETHYMTTPARTISPQEIAELRAFRQEVEAI